MKIIILTQHENVYLPKSFATVCSEISSDVVAVVCSPAMSTHGGAVEGLIKHLCLFGLNGGTRMAWRVVSAKALSLIRAGEKGPYYSVKQVARAFRLPFYSVRKINSKRLYGIIENHKPDLLISISCPQIVGKGIRRKLPMGCINVHGAPLPKYRGLMPTFWVLRNGESKTAVTVHELGARLDDGDILIQKEVEIAANDTWDSLVYKTKALGVQALLEAVCQIRDGSITRKPNREEQATYFSFPTASDRIAFHARGRRFF